MLESKKLQNKPKVLLNNHLIIRKMLIREFLRNNKNNSPKQVAKDKKDKIKVKMKNRMKEYKSIKRLLK